MKKFTAPILLFCLIVLVCICNPATASDAIQIGAPTPMSGPYVSDGIGYYRGVKMAVDDINNSGGLLGRSVEIIRFDVQDFSPEVIMQAADHLIGKKKVAAIHAGWAGWGQDIRAYGKYDVPTFVWDGSDSSIEVFRENPEKYSNIFNMCDGERAHAFQTFNTMRQLPYTFPKKSVFIVNADDAWGSGIGNGIAESARSNGWKIDGHEVVPYGVRDWRPILTKVRENKPALLHMEVLSTPDMITFFRQFMEQPTNTLLNFGYGGAYIDFVENMGETIDGLLGMSAGLPMPLAPTPAANEWLQRYKNEFESDPSTGTVTVYTGVMFWAEAVKSVGDVDDFAKINQYIAENSFETIAGGHWKFNEDHVIPFSQDNPCIQFQIQNGKRVTIYTAPGVPYMNYEFQKPRWID